MSKFEIESDMKLSSSEIKFSTSYGGEKCEHDEIEGNIAKRRLALEFILRDIYILYRLPFSAEGA